MAPRRGARATALAVTLGALGAGCGDLAPKTCDRSEDANPPVLYTEGTVEGGVYMSTPWDGGGGGASGLLYFPGGMRYEIEHKLGGIPRWWQLYLSFDREGIETGTLAQAAGNQAEVLHVDACKLVVANGSCSEYWLLVVAGASDGSAEPGQCDAGGAD
ncbi:MAG: hypothetical protein IT372_14935 [Polyangiaceae bacterium]|nr:hypothetical protein [Polyangiaceae bacterium]